eukprot:jgi/Botrbrau1/2745/Bobra.0164s0025.1
MEGVLEDADSFQEVQDVIARYETLKATNDDLKASLQQASRKAEEARAGLQVYVKTATDENLNLNNQISELEKEVERLQQETYSLEAKKDYALQSASQKTLESGQVGLVVENLYQRSCQSSRIARAKVQDHLRQLVVIGDFVSDLGEVIREVKLQGKATAHAPVSRV